MCYKWYECFKSVLKVYYKCVMSVLRVSYESFTSVLHVTCPLSLMPTATATDPPPASCPIIRASMLAHSRLNLKTGKGEKCKKLLKQKERKKLLLQANISYTPFDLKSPRHPEVGVLSQIDKKTNRLYN